MEKLRDESESIKSIQKINETIGDNSKDITDFNVVNSTCRINKENNSVINVTNEVSDQNTNSTSGEKQRQKEVPFSKMEDQFLRDGLKKYGKGKWKSIISDSGYKFHPSRKTATLLIRAKSQGFI